MVLLNAGTSVKRGAVAHDNIILHQERRKNGTLYYNQGFAQDFLSGGKFCKKFGEICSGTQSNLYPLYTTRTHIQGFL